MPKLKDNMHLYLLAALVLILGAVAFFYSNAREAVPGIPEGRLEEERAREKSDAVMVPDDPESCIAAGGTWNPCASACPDAGPDEVCIQVCVERCEFP